MKYAPLLLLSIPLAVQAVCGPAEQTMIGSEVKCFETGVDIGYLSEEGIKVACMQDKRVQSSCGTDGQVTRLQAYRQWFAKLKAAENACVARGGDFSFSDPGFVEPSNESFCHQAQPEIGSNMFEGSLCNYKAVCPSIAVVCEVGCKSEKSTASYDPSLLLYPAEDEGFLKRLVSR